MAIFSRTRPRLTRAPHLAPEFTLPDPEALGNILPSYQLYEATFSKAVTPAADDYDYAPPTYAAVLPPDAGAAGDYFSPQSRWENSILANVHRMKHLAEVAPELAALLQVEVTLTTPPDAAGVAQPYDGETREFRQRDRIHGYITVCNVLATALPFSMCLVVFEGKATVAGWGERPLQVHKFLNMFDYTASWTPAHFAEAPPIHAADGSRLAFSAKREFAPGVAYKKFFSFTVPEQLLDSCCATHGFAHHCHVPPLLGVDKGMFLQRMRRARSAHRRPPLRLRDYGFSDTALSYCVEARVVGRHAHEFVIMSHASAPVRVVPRTVADAADASAYRALVAEVERGLAAGRAAQSPGGALGRAQNSPRAGGPATKLSQLYQPPASVPAPFYCASVALKKKLLAQPAKVVGTVAARTPAGCYRVPYVSPYKQVKLPGLVVTVPVLLTCTDTKTLPPEIKAVAAEVVACTVRLRKHPIPIELTPELCISPDGGFDKVVAQFAAHLDEYTLLAASVPLLRMLAAETVTDLKCMAALGVKTNAFKVPAVEAVRGLGVWRKDGAGYAARMDVAVDLGSVFRDSNEQCLVPSFQSCLLCRYYYLVVTVRLHTGEAVAVRASVVIEN